MKAQSQEPLHERSAGPPAESRPRRRTRHRKPARNPGHLFVSFWDLTLDNIPEGVFAHRLVKPDEAKRLIANARKTGTLRCASHEDLFAPYKKRESAEHKKLCRVLGEYYGIPLSIRDFVSVDDVDGTRSVTIRPLVFAEVAGSDRLIVVNCHYIMARDRKKSELKVDVEPASVTFHLLEAVRK
jgi:hypothetical protein